MTQTDGMISEYHGMVLVSCSSKDREMLRETGKIHAGDLFFEVDTGNTMCFDGAQYSTIATQDDLAMAYGITDRVETRKVDRVKVCHCPDCGAPVDRSARTCAYCGVPYPVEYE